jgi:hypothetical protein
MTTLDQIFEKVLIRLSEKFGVKMGDAEYTGPGVPDEGDMPGGIYAKRSKKKLRVRKTLAK